jgi:hypothetical protein
MGPVLEIGGCPFSGLFKDYVPKHSQKRAAARFENETQTVLAAVFK